jgi:hypothetical protein
MVLYSQAVPDGDGGNDQIHKAKPRSCTILKVEMNASSE